MGDDIIPICLFVMVCENWLLCADNIHQGKTVAFNIKADATQKQNNSNKDFGD